MLSKIKLTKKQWFFYLFLFLFITLLVLGIYYVTDDKRQFHRFTEGLFRSDLSGNTLNLHYTLAYPENYGLDGKAVLPSYSGGNDSSENQNELLSSLAALAAISKDKLNSNDAYAYELLERYLKRRLKGEQFTYYSDPFSPNSGMQSGLPILLADYTFRKEQDVIDYLDLIEQTQDYFSGLTAYETEKSKAGLFMADYSAEKVIEQCDMIMDKQQLEEGTHFLITTFSERLSELVKQNIITQAAADQYISENNRLLTTVMQPAYEQTGDAFILLNGTGTNEQGLFYFPEGRAYYEYLLASTTGSDRSIAEIKKLLFEDFQNNYNALIALIRQYPEIADSSLSDSFALPLADPEEMLSDLQNRMSRDFPCFPIQNQSFTPACTIKNVSASMENYCSPAYYLTPPIDDMRNNIIYINGKNSPDSLSLYTTLAHEGYPGHLYQTVYSQMYMNQNDDSCIRYLLHYGGYVEGWALYVENLSYYYAQAQVKTNPYAAAYYEACRLNRNLQLCLYSLLDISIHYEGASLEQVQRILQTIGITSQTAVTGIYQYIVEEPVNYLKYYLGFLEFQLLKEEAAALWGDSFTLYRFHQFVLETGPSDFIGLHTRLSG